MVYIGTIRYNTQTYNEILEWKKRKNWKGCIYGINKELSTKKMYNNGSFPINSYIYVIEMDNDNIRKFKPLIKLYDRADIINDIA